MAGIAVAMISAAAIPHLTSSFFNAKSSFSEESFRNIKNFVTSICQDANTSVKLYL